MTRLQRAALIAVVVLLASVGHAAADDPSGAVPFPYAGLAALSALETEEWFAVNGATVVRKRPGLEQRAAARLEAGDVVAPRSITAGEDPWLSVLLEGGASGWARLAELDLPREAVKHLPMGRARPIVAAPAGNERIWLYGRPADQSDYSWAGILEGDRQRGYYTKPVLGRSLDARWVALYSRWQRPKISWARAEQIELIGADLGVADLPIFIWDFTALIPTGDLDGRAAIYLPPTLEMAWTSAGALIGVQEDAYWRYDAERGELEVYPRPRGDATLSPNGEYLAVAVCTDGWGECGVGNYVPFDVLIMRTNGAPPMRVPGVSLRPWAASKFAVSYRVGTWSPDSRALLVPRAEPSNEGHPGASLAWSVVSVDGEQRDLPSTSVLGVRLRQYWHWLDSETLFQWEVPYIDPEWARTIRRDSSRHHTVSFPESHERAGWIQVVDAAGEPSRRVLAWSEQEGWGTFEPTTGSLARLEALEEVGGDVRRLTPEDQAGVAFVTPGGDAQAIIVIGATGWDPTETEPHTTATAPRAKTWRMKLRPSGGALIARFSDGGHSELPTYEVGEDPQEQRSADVSVESADRRVCGGPWDWSPDGEHFVFLSRDTARFSPHDSWHRDGLYSPSEDGGPRTLQIRVYNQSGALEHSFRTAHDDAHHVSQVQWSADGRWLAVGQRLIGEWECNCCP